jgi:hypothetical protein
MDGWDTRGRNRRGIPHCADSVRNDGLTAYGASELSEVEEFAEAFGLLAGDGDFGLFFVVHF